MGVAQRNVSDSVVILTGPPGCGKGTFGNLLHSHLMTQGHFMSYLFEMGGACRQLFKNENLDQFEKDLYTEIPWEVMQSGGILPDELILKLFFYRMKKQIKMSKEYGLQNLNRSSIFIIDGIPRTESQSSQILANMFSSEWGIGYKNVVTVNFDLPTNICLERLERRAIKEGRTDDKDKKTRSNRMLEYNIHRESVLSVLAKHTRIFDEILDGSECPEAVFQMVSKMVMPVLDEIRSKK